MAATTVERLDSIEFSPNEKEPRSSVNSYCVIGAQNESPPEIFRLNVDCFYEIFEFLQLQDLASIARTCNRLQAVAGAFYRSNYKSKRIDAEHGGDSILYSHVDIFSPFFEKISISGDNLNVYSFVASNCRSIKELRLSKRLPIDAIKCLNGIFKTVQLLEMSECLFEGDFYECLLKYCSKLNSLSVKRSNQMVNSSVNHSIIIGCGNEWLLREYPMVQHIELTDLLEVDELDTFFKYNCNVRSFSTDVQTLWANRKSFLACSIKLDKLAIEISAQEALEPIHIDGLLMELHERGFFKRLHIYSTFNAQNYLDRVLFSLTSTVEFLHGMFTQIDNVLVNLTTLGLNNAFDISNIHVLPKKLPNLEQIYFSEATIDHILPFIQSSVKLKRVKTLRILYPDGIYHLMQFHNLKDLNRERESLAGARKVTLYIPERLIFRSKLLNEKMRFPLIEIRPFDSSEWIDLNAHFRHNHSKKYF